MKIKTIKKNGKKYKIELEDGNSITTYDDLILKYNILYKKEINNELINKIENENIFYDAYNCTLSYISKKLRSLYEVQNFLNKFLISTEEKQNIITKLKELKLINDKNFTESFINDKINFTNYGPYRIKKELEKYKIEDEIINKSLNKIDQNIYYEKVKKIIDQKIKINKKYSGNVLKQKITIELINLGYPNDIIYDVLNTINIKGNINEIYNKLYQKLSKKYSGYELEKIIDQKLYSLGYNKTEIEEKNQL